MPLPTGETGNKVPIKTNHSIKCLMFGVFRMEQYCYLLDAVETAVGAVGFCMWEDGNTEGM